MGLISSRIRSLTKSEMEVLVFKTSITSYTGVASVAPVLDAMAGHGNWNFALDDCDRILRIVSNSVDPSLTIFALNELGFECSELED